MGAIAWSLGRRIKKRRVMKSMADSVIRLKRQLRYQGTILKIYEDTVLANGHEAHWDFIHHDGAAAVLPVTDDGKILMVRQTLHKVSICY